ncbi:hypothetical protein KDK77_09565, partial [bacterium]|nr:hypothetical protein [bacterium]
ALTINLNVEKLQKEHIARYQTVFARYPGKCPVYFRMDFSNNYSVLLQTDSMFGVLPNEVLLHEIENVCEDTSLFFKL